MSSKSTTKGNSYHVTFNLLRLTVHKYSISRNLIDAWPPCEAYGRRYPLVYRVSIPIDWSKIAGWHARDHIRGQLWPGIYDGRDLRGSTISIVVVIRRMLSKLIQRNDTLQLQTMWERYTMGLISYDKEQLINALIKEQKVAVRSAERSAYGAEGVVGIWGVHGSSKSE